MKCRKIGFFLMKNREIFQYKNQWKLKNRKSKIRIFIGFRIGKFPDFSWEKNPIFRLFKIFKLFFKSEFFDAVKNKMTVHRSRFVHFCSFFTQMHFCSFYSEKVTLWKLADTNVHGGVTNFRNQPTLSFKSRVWSFQNTWAHRKRLRHRGERSNWVRTLEIHPNPPFSLLDILISMISRAWCGPGNLFWIASSYEDVAVNFLILLFWAV